VPYPHATDDHQLANARELEIAGAAEIFLDEELTPRGLADRISALVEDAGRRAAMSAAADGWATPDADDRVAALVRSVARP
jgi:UDP-N-acetylglucosamine--N-acetylmuramyl-(pentapeptide) pyrophosphoryl-undecaprenol N-acetylglucosamine transferase